MVGTVQLDRRHADRQRHGPRRLPRLRPPASRSSCAYARRGREADPRRPELDLIQERGFAHEQPVPRPARGGRPDRRRDRREASPPTPAELRAAARRDRRGDARGRRRHLPGDVLRRPWRGHADFLLRRDDRPSVLGAWSYDIADTKLARGQGRGASSRCASTRTCSSRLQGIATGDDRRRDRRPRLARPPTRRLRGLLPRVEGSVRGRGSTDGRRRRSKRIRSPSTTAASARGGRCASTVAAPTTTCRSSRASRGSTPAPARRRRRRRRSRSWPALDAEAEGREAPAADPRAAPRPGRAPARLARRPRRCATS